MQSVEKEANCRPHAPSSIFEGGVLDVVPPSLAARKDWLLARDQSSFESIDSGYNEEDLLIH